MSVRDGIPLTHATRWFQTVAFFSKNSVLQERRTKRVTCIIADLSGMERFSLVFVFRRTLLTGYFILLTVQESNQYMRFVLVIFHWELDRSLGDSVLSLNGTDYLSCDRCKRKMQMLGILLGLFNSKCVVWMWYLFVSGFRRKCKD